jgi:hypothetical protein
MIALDFTGEWCCDCHPGRVCHGHKKTHEFKVTGFAGTDTVLNLAYPCHGITGMLQVYYHRLRIILLFFLSYLVVFFPVNSLYHTVTQPNMALPVRI